MINFKKPMFSLGFRGLLLLALLAQAACSSHPLMRSATATSTDAADDIVRALDSGPSGATAANAHATVPPPDISAALLPPLAPEADREERFDVNARGVDAGAFFESLVNGTRYNVVVHPDVVANIDLRLRDVTVPEVMDIVADVYDLDIERKGRLYQVRSNRVQTRIFPIDYLHFKRRGSSETRVSSGQVTSARNNGDSGNASADSEETRNLVGTSISTATESDFWQDIQGTLAMMVGADGQVVVNPGAGLVMVRASGEQLRLVEDYLTRTELIMKRQVVLEAKILEVTLNEGYQQGISWSDLQRHSSEVLSGQTIQAPDIGGLFSATFSDGSFTALIELLGTQGNVQILSSPRISTVNNQKAVIKVGTDEFFVTDIDFDEDNSAVTASDTTSTSVELTPFFSGISLDVTPQIGEDGTVTLHVHPSVSEVTDQEKVITIGERDVTLPLASSTVRETDSVIRAQSGQIVVIGGLIQNTSEDNNSAVPFFSEIPLLGELFKQRHFDARKSELVILLRPVVVQLDTMAKDIAASRERMSVLRELLQSSKSVMPEPENTRH
ncbi:pilus (MSHA type) biogenesis protein MshL [Marinobacter lutaoensis]|uniref:pilus (MSHA type) biogenesis protein MshL n=1 Tax=Marinobacter lutaoensis TaxID=135739 RepID=UPI0020CF33F4|nr:pilus (MSHA type) biogenesis protein MshL [Marinobacter lutaoensis]